MLKSLPRRIAAEIPWSSSSMARLNLISAEQRCGTFVGESPKVPDAADDQALTAALVTVHATLLRIAITSPPRVSIPTITAAAIAPAATVPACVEDRHRDTGEDQRGIGHQACASAPPSTRRWPGSRCARREPTACTEAIRLKTRVLAEQTAAVDPDRLGKSVGFLSFDEMRRVAAALRASSSIRGLHGAL